MAELVFDHYDSADERRREALLSLGNGVLCWRASAPEAAFSSGGTQHYPGLYRAGWYDNALREVNGQPTRIESLVNLPDPFGLTFSTDGTSWFGGAIEAYRQSVDVQSSVLRRVMRLRLGGRYCELKEERFVSMADPTLVVLRWELDCEQPLDRLYVKSSLETCPANHLIERDRAYEGRRLELQEAIHHENGFSAVRARLPACGEDVAVACQLVTPPNRWATHMDNGSLIQEATWQLSGASFVIEKRVRVLLGHEIPQSLAAIAPLMPTAPFESLRSEHAQRWQALWDEVQAGFADETLNTPLLLGIWQVLQSSPMLRDDCDQGLPSRGWQEGYFGQVFWDEIFVLPFLASRFPQVSERLLAYRHRRLETAKMSAREAGYQGAMFPWRSARSGTEQTPPWRLNPLSNRWMADPTCLQRHIGSAVAYDAWQHYLTTGDTDWLIRVGAELMIEVARFWATFVVYCPDANRYMIRGVIGPDEYHNAYPGNEHPGLDNNAYTNVMAAWVLFQARLMLDHLPAHARTTLEQRLALGEGEPARWTAIAEKIYLPFLQDGVLNQFDGYERLAASPPNWQKNGGPRLDWLLEARHDCTDCYQLAKQADVLTLFYLLTPLELQRLCARMGYAFDDAAMQRTAAFHLARITHESSLSKLVCAGALAHLQPEASWSHFCDCIRTDLDAPAGSGTLEGVHLAAMGGAVDVLQRHYLGCYPTCDALQLRPAIPAALDDVSLRLRFHGRHVRVRLHKRQLSVELEAGAPALDILHNGQRSRLEPGEARVIDCPTPTAHVRGDNH